MSDDEATPAAEGHPFASYTPADHARVALATDMLMLAGHCHHALIPEWADSEVPPATAAIRAAADIMGAAQRLMEAAVTAAYESGLTWEQIGRALSYRKAEGITRQSAHAAYSPAVTEFREQLAAAADRTARGGNYYDGPVSRICNTSHWAPRIDQAATAEHPGMLAPGAQPGAFLATLSDPATAAPAPIGAGVRGPDERTPWCRYTAELDHPYQDGVYGWLACTLPEGHAGGHQLSVATEE
jgi:hypothetical protein